MSLINDKKNVFNEIGALNSISSSLELPNSTNSLSSINNKEDVGAFLIDILSTLVGTEAMKSVLGNTFLEFSEKSKDTLKDGLSDQLIDYDSEDALPTNFVNNGYDIKVKDIDLYGKLKTDPSSDIGSLIYEGGINPENFERKAYLAITTPNVDVPYKNIIIRYNDATDMFNIRPSNGGVNIRQFTQEFINNMFMFNKQTFIAEVLNAVFGTKSRAQNKTIEEIVNENKIDRTLEKIIDNEENLDISDSELRELQDEARQISQGVREVDVGCSLLTSIITVEKLQELNDTILNSNDPDVAGNAVSDAILDSFPEGFNSRKNKNQQTIRDGLLKRIIKAIIRILSAAITVSPEARLIIGIVTGFRNNDTPELGNPVNDLKNQKELIKCLIKKAKEIFFEFLFNLVKEQLIKLIIPISKEILKEKINQYIGVLRSLVNFGG